MHKGQLAAWVLIGLRLLARGLVRPDGHLQRGVLIALHAKRSAFPFGRGLELVRAQTLQPLGVP
jgi:hypothetical protein